MKILHIANHLNTGGITTYLLTLVREQTLAGHEVFIWASRGQCLEAFYDRTRRVISDVPRCKSELSPRLWAQLPRMIRFLKENQIDIVHTHSRVAQVLSAVATRCVGIPYLSTAHMFYKRRLGRRLFPCWGKRIIAISNVMAEGLNTIFGPKNLPPVTVVMNGVDMETLRKKIAQVNRTEIRKAYGYGPQDRVVLSLSRLIPVKGVHILIEAFTIALKEEPHLKLLVAGIGDEDYERQLKSMVSELGLSGSVQFVGDQTAIEKPFKAADIFVGAYLWPEAFGLSVLEAMAVGLPVITSRSGGLVDLLGNGKRGLLFEQGNCEALAQCIVRYVREPALQAQVVATASRSIEEYSSKRMFAGVQQVYEEVLKPYREDKVSLALVP